MIYNKMSRNELRELLSENVLRVTFDKKNGEKRVMTCTLQQSMLPPPRQGDGTRNRTEADTSLSVWDTNANGWRAFCLENVLEIEKV